MNFMRDYIAQAEKTPDAPALHHDGRAYSHGELMSLIDGCGLALKRLGVGPGERVALMMNNRPEFVIAYQATVKIGATIVPINTFLKDAELAHQLNDVGAKVFIGNDWSALSIMPIKDKLDTVREIILTGVENVTDFQEFISGEKGGLEMFDARDDDVAVIKYTSGTTGRPKGAMQTHGNVYRFVRDNMDISPLDPDKCIMLFVPLFHGFGDHCCMNPVFMCGASFVLMDPFKPVEIFKAIEKYRVIYFGCTPSMLYGLMNHPEVDNYDLSSLERVLTGGGPVTRDLIDGFKNKFGVDVLQGYGLTEGCAGYTYTRADMEFRPGSCGVPLPNVNMEIVGEDGNELPRGEPGEVAVKSPYNMKGYWNNETATDETIIDGWLHTGDVGYMDEDDYLYLVDRVKDMIIMSGENIYPTEIEDILADHPAVGQAAVIGAPDERRGEVPCAVIVPAPGQTITEEEVIEYLKPRLASFKVPKMVKFRDAMPTNAVFKVLKRELRKEYFGK